MVAKTVESIKIFVINVRVPLLENVLWFIPLRIGNIVLAVAAAVFYFVMSISVIIKYVVDTFDFMSRVTYGIVIILMIIHITNCWVLVAGIVEKRSELLYPWLWSHALLTCIVVWGFMHIRLTTNEVFNLIGWICLQIYVWICGYSMYHQIRTRVATNSAESVVATKSAEPLKHENVFSTALYYDDHLPWATKRLKPINIEIHKPLK